MLDLNLLETALATRSAYKIRTTTKKLFNSKHSENENINSLFAVDVVQMAHSHIMYVTFKYFIASIESTGFKCPNIKASLYNLAKIYALTELQQDCAALYETGYFQMGTATLIQEALKVMMNTVRPQMIPLVEAWGIPDSVLVSAIGNSYGDIYE